MADEENNNTPPPPQRNRRSSFAGETLANLFGNGQRGSLSRSPSEATKTGSQQPSQSYSGPITSAAAQAQSRRLSMSTTLGLSGASYSSTPFGSFPTRRDSYVSGNSDSIDESAIEDDVGSSAPTPQTPFARRVSFGAKALRDVKAGGGGSPTAQNGGHNSSTGTTSTANGQMPSNGTVSSRDVKGRGSSEGFNWSDNFRSRAERTSSIVGGVGLPAGSNGGMSGSPRAAHGRAQSVAVMEPPIREMPKPKEQVRPDHFQERILKGDFYMD